MECTAQGLISAPVDRVWELAADPERQTEWWPDQEEFEVVGGEAMTEGCTVRQVTHRGWPQGDLESELSIDRLRPGQEVFIRCLETGTCTKMLFTPAQGQTFVEVTAGNDMENLDRTSKLLLTVGGRRVFSRWVQHALDRLKQAAEQESVAA